MNHSPAAPRKKSPPLKRGGTLLARRCAAARSQQEGMQEDAPCNISRNDSDLTQQANNQQEASKKSARSPQKWSKLASKKSARSRGPRDSGAAPETGLAVPANAPRVETGPSAGACRCGRLRVRESDSARAEARARYAAVLTAYRYLVTVESAAKRGRADGLTPGQCDLVAEVAGTALSALERLEEIQDAAPALPQADGRMVEQLLAGVECETRARSRAAPERDG